MSIAKKVVPGIAGAVQLYYGKPAPGWGNVRSKINANQLAQAFQSAVAGLTGVRLGNIAGQAKTEVDFLQTINPFDFRSAGVPKVILVTRLAMEGLDATVGFVRGIFNDLKKGL